MNDNNSSIKRILNRITLSLSLIVHVIWFILIKQVLMLSFQRAFSNSVAAFSLRAISNSSGDSIASLSSSSSLTALSSSLSNINVASPKVKQIHLCVLVHGLFGNASEMGYIQESMLKKMENEESKAKKSPTATVTADSDDDDAITTTQFIVHSAISNEGKTSDGIKAGGDRLANEVNTIIDHLFKQHEEKSNQTPSSPMNISLSFVGNSLGGLYARYALSGIKCAANIQFNIFMTTATPHLGKTGLSYLRIPTMAEKIVGKILQPTGEDLFFDCATNINSGGGANNKNENNLVLIERMSIENCFMKPLSLFKKRIAYANAYGTDFQVPTNTAAFLSNTASIHNIIQNDDDNSSNVDVSETSEILLTVETPKHTEGYDNKNYNNNNNNNEEARDIIADRMALRLDALGWTKVFVDLRSTLLEIPMLMGIGGNDASTFTPKNKKSATNSSSIHNCYTASELRSLFGNKLVNQNKFPIPFGHTMMIANSKSAFYAKLNAGGRPLVDKMTSKLYDDIFSS